MRTFWNNVVVGAARGLGFCLIVSCFAAAALLAQSLKTFEAGELISASSMNANFSEVKSEITEAVPDGAIMAFYLTACPTGWTPADGIDPATPDLRGNFLRGLDAMGNGPANVDTGRAFGSVQTDAFQGHRHYREPSGLTEAFITQVTGAVHSLPSLGGFSFNGSGVGNTTGDPVANVSGHGTPRTAAETRPRNMALIFCMRTNN